MPTLSQYNDLEIELLQYVRANPYGGGRLDLPPECFLNDSTRKALEIIKSFHRENTPPTPGLLRARGLPNDLIEIVKKEPKADFPADAYAQALRERYAKNYWYEVSKELQYESRNGVSATAITSKIDQHKERVSRYIGQENTGETLEESQEAYKERALSGKKPAGTFRLHLPFAGFKGKLPGLNPNTPMAIAAYSGYGKTTLLEMLGEAWAQQGHNGVYFNFELNDHNMRQRRIMRWSGVSVIDQDAEEENPGHLTESQRQDIQRAMAQIAAWPGNIQYIQCSGWDVDQIIAVAQRLNDRRPWRVKNADPIHFIIIDYLGLLGFSGDTGGNMTEAYRSAILKFKNAGMRNGWVNIIAGQFDKQSTSKKFPIMTDVLYAGSAMDQYHNVCLIIDRETSDERDEVYDKGRLRMPKATYGKKSFVPVQFDPTRMRFVEVQGNEW